MDFYLNIFSIVIYSCDAKHLQSLVSHDPSEIILICWFDAQETLLSILNVQNSYAASYFVESVIFFNNSN